MTIESNFDETSLRYLIPPNAGSTNINACSSLSGILYLENIAAHNLYDHLQEGKDNYRFLASYECPLIYFCN